MISTAERRLVGVDLGIASDHTVRVLRGDGSEVCRRRARPTVESLTRLEAAALAGAPAGTRLEVVVEPTGPAWLPVAVFFTTRGHRVFRVASAKAADLRRFLSRHAKSNGIDADTLARLPLLAPGSLQPLELPGVEAAALDRRVRACDQGALHQRRIKDLVRQLMPVTPLTGELTKTDLAVLAHWADPRALLAAGRSRLLARITKTSHGQQGAARTDAWRAAAQAAVDLYGEHPAVAYSDLAAEVLTEVRLLTAVRAELVGHAEARADAYRWTDPARLAASLPGLAEVGAPTVTAIVGRAARFRTGKQFRSFTGLAPRASETGETDRKGQPMSKAGNRLLRTTLVRAADHARRADPQLAQIYYTDGRARRRAPQGLLRRRCPPGRTAACGPGPRHALRRLRHRRQSRRPGHGQADHRRALDRPARGPGPPAQPQARRRTAGDADTGDQGGEGPSPSPPGT